MKNTCKLVLFWDKYKTNAVSFFSFFKILLNYSQPTLSHSAGRTELSIAISYHDWLDHLLSPSTLRQLFIFLSEISQNSQKKRPRSGAKFTPKKRTNKQINRQRTIHKNSEQTELLTKTTKRKIRYAI